jgi:cytochrome c biogenesis protein CcmG, thiol:disulfide interchange protein DsbE
VSATCERFRARLLDLASNSEMGRDGHEGLSEHVRSCEECAAELVALREGLALFNAPSDEPSSAIRARLVAYARGVDSSTTGRDRAAGTRTGWPRTAKSRLRWVAAGTTAALLLAASAAQWTSRASPDADPYALEVGTPFPAFSAISVGSGEPISLSDLAGRVVLLNIWATWCGPCESEMPSMERLYQELGPAGLAVVAVSVDQESTNKVRRWVDERGITFTVLHDREGRFEQSFRNVGVPESFVIDRAGRLVAREIGPQAWDSPEKGRIIRDLLLDGPD